MVTILTIIVSRVGGFAGQIQTPYPLLALAGWIAWQMFARGMGDSALSLTTNVNLVTKVYFPRILLPTAPLLTSLVDFAVALALLLGMMAIYGRVPSWPVIFVPAFAAMALLASLSIGLWLAALNAVYRDVRHMLPFLTQVWLLVSPVAYPHTLVPERYRLIYALNPMVGVIGGLRWALLGEPPPHWGMLAASLAATVLLLAGGLWYFHRTEADLADVV
jgi:lipopolysaccharide transport system permease protein